MRLKYVLLLFLATLFAIPTNAQKRKNTKDDDAEVRRFESVRPLETLETLKLEWRNIGPFRGGRSAAVAGVSGKSNLYYMGAAGGGVWRTKDGGNSWHNISDGFFGGSIGAIAVSEYDNNVIYVGGGEVTVRGNVSSGYGMWRTTDAGKTWKSLGLDNSKHIPRIQIHPKNPDLVYAAVLGDLYKSTSERGVYRSKNGGETWEQVLFANENAGAVDLILDPTNPRIIYASTWRIRRTPYSLESGGEGCALWKSTDGGDNWTEISTNRGFPKGDLGIIGVTVSPQNGDRVWAIVENENGGVFRSEDGGETWQKVNSDRKLRQRAWYYSRIYADPLDEDAVYVLNVSWFKSKDGGKTFESKNSEHGDHHDLWIDPNDSDRMIIGDDGGGQVSFDNGENWTTYHNQPTAQFYRVTTDNHFPFRIYAAQQDNSTVRIAHRTTGGSITERDWESTAGGESAHIAIDPTDNEIVYGGSYGGFFSRYNHRTNQQRSINVYPDNPMGHGAVGMRYRFQWNFPIFFSQHNPKKLYTCSQHLHVTENEGQTWTVISPDLTRNDTSKMQSSGGPITKDNTGVEYYCTIFAAAESPLKEGVIWTGSDDGLVHLTKDGGKNWDNITPKNMPEWLMINSIEPDPHNEAGAYIAGTLYKTGDYQPYLYKTSDYGKTWTKITNGIDKEHFTRVVRADPNEKGLLYAGTEAGMYISFDDGKNWEIFQLNLPIVPITDLTIKDNMLIAATQGRSLWMLDDLTILHQLKNEKIGDFKLFQPKPTYRMDGYQSSTKTEGTNHASGVLAYFYLKEFDTKKDTVYIFLMENDGDTIRSFSTKPTDDESKLKVEKGGNLFQWNMNYPNAEKFDGMVNWWSSLAGAKAVPGTYKISLSVNGETQTQNFEILADPRSEATLVDMQAQFDFSIDLRNKVSETHKAIGNIRKINKEINSLTKGLDQEKYADLIHFGDSITNQLSEIEKTLYQTKNQSSQDPLNFPIRLNNKLAHLNSLVRIGDFRPTDQAIQVKNDISALIDVQLTEYYKIVEVEIPVFNRLVRVMEVDLIEVD
jgi:photosystem II stability/assembly factor-like uncharacterized protein